MPIKKPTIAEITRHLITLLATIAAVSPILVVLLIPVWFLRPDLLIYAAYFSLLAITPIVLCSVSDRGMVLMKWHYHGIPTAADEAHKEDMEL